MRGVFLLFLTFSLSYGESFITKEEYAAGLYHNPRGVGCHLCHGEAGEGKMVAQYRDNGEKKVFAGPAIRKLSFKDFYEKLNDRILGMPRYYLTDTEIQTLYYYLHREEFKRAAAPQPPKTK
ncbi:MAG: cytochrome c [Sulfuricurvum sp.]|uniref:c-type cytochrome n=1 Tax=Sulfuricurvum sp. TaxID=2025608 RepID=UPI0025D158AA|nr:cytochrome c [Sulfuricurvum sp.]MCI4406585.1 cytochrome c [Sulfuricurvum sp.]